MGSKRVLRGGSWNNIARNLRAAARNANHPGDRNDNLGFRLARAQAPAGAPAPDPTDVLSARSTAGRRRSPGRRCARRTAEADPSARRRPLSSEAT